MPRVSVLLPCFNDGAWMDEAIDSVFAQTCQDFEVIVVDDGSTDAATTEKLASWRKPRTTVLRTENRGLPAARNHAARNASGAIFCALDADDRLAPTWFEKGLQVLDADVNVAFVSHWLETFGDEHWTWTPADCDLPALLARNAVNGAALVRRGAFDAVGGFDETMREGCEDWDFWLRLVERGYRGAIVPEVLFYYRRRAESMSRTMTAQAAYERPLARLIAKHQDAYRRHLVDVLVAKEAEALHLLREVSDLRRDRLTIVNPALVRAREERNAWTAKADRVRAERTVEEEREHLAWKTAELTREVEALRSSWSWRITKPLRRVFAWIARTGAHQ